MPKKKMYQRPDGLYEKGITIDGKRIRFRGKTEREVMQKIANYEAKQETGMTFVDVAEQWRNEYSADVEYYSYIKSKAAYNSAIAFFDSEYIKDITPRDISRYYAFLASKGYAKKTVNNYKAIVSNVFKYAIVKGYADTNPTTMAAVPKKLKQTKRTLPSDEDIAKVKQSVDCESGFLALFLMYTGCRKGEALALQYKDIDLKKKVIKVYKSVYYEGNLPKIKQPKTENGIREIPLLDALIPHIPKGKAEEYIFSIDGTRPYTHSTFNRRWSKYQQQSGVTCTPHQLRHAYATMLYEAGLDERIAMEIMGHSDIATTRNIYTHIRTSKLDKAAEILNSLNF